MKNNLLSSACAVLVWVLGVSFYLGSFYVPIIENPEKQANIILAIGIIPSAVLGSYLFYCKGKMKPSKLAFMFVVTAVLLDVLITIPVFVMPEGGSYSEFFKNPMFYGIVLEFYLLVFYFGNYLNQRKKQ